MSAGIVTHMVILLQFQQWEYYNDDTSQHKHKQWFSFIRDHMKW